MKILWDSSEMTCQLILVDESGEIYAYEWQAGRELARDMLAYLKEKLDEHEKDFQDIEAIGVKLGPGSFTGLRIGITVLNTMASSLKIPIVGATGDDWTEKCLMRLAAGENDEIVLPEYGSEANITKPRK